MPESYKFHGISIDHIGSMQNVGDDQFAWAEVTFYLTDPTTNTHPSAGIRIPIQYDDDYTVARIHNDIGDKTLAALKTMASLLEEHGLEGLKQLADQEAREAQSLTRLKSLMDGEPN